MARVPVSPHAAIIETIQDTRTRRTPIGRERRFQHREHHRRSFLTISHVKHWRAEVRSPQTNAFCERLHRTIQQEFFSSAFRNTLYESVMRVQDRSGSLLGYFYNRERAYRGYRTEGRTPPQAFLDGLNLRPRREAT